MIHLLGGPSEETSGAMRYKEDDHSFGLNCQPCHRWVEIIPQEWLDAGKPDIDYVEQRFKCEVCGGKADKQVRTVNVGQIAQHLPLPTPETQLT